MENYNQMKSRHQKAVDNLPMYFAFGDRQFNELREKLGFETEEEMLKNVFTLGAGSIILKKDKELVMNTFEQNSKEMKKAMKDDDFLLSAFEYELGNHEYIITYEIDETLDALGITPEEYSNSDRMKRIMKQAKINYLNEMEKFGY